MLLTYWKIPLLEGPTFLAYAPLHNFDRSVVDSLTSLKIFFNLQKSFEIFRRKNSYFYTEITLQYELILENTTSDIFQYELILENIHPGPLYCKHHYIKFIEPYILVLISDLWISKGIRENSDTRKLMVIDKIYIVWQKYNRLYGLDTILPSSFLFLVLLLHNILFFLIELVLKFEESIILAKSVSCLFTILINQTVCKSNL